jgi:hypothetical protein
VNNSWYQTLMTNQGDGNALSNSTAATSLLTGNAAHAKLTLPQNFCAQIGQKMRVVAHGRISTVVTTPGTLSLDIRFGATAVFAGGAMTLNTVAQTNTPWIYEVDLTLRIVGASAQWFGYGKWTSHAVIGAAAIGTGGATSQMLPYNTAPAIGTAFDATATQQVDLFATWSVANASNSIQLHNYELLSCN